jgi:hypothetical protein
MDVGRSILRVFIVVSLMVFTTNALGVIKLGDGSASGQWYDPNRSGEGFFVEEIGEGEDRLLGVAMYTFDEAGNQLWFTGVGGFTPGDIGAIVPVKQVEGPMWGSAYDPADATDTDFGTVTVQFTSCTTALFSIDSNIPGLESFDHSTVRLTWLTGVFCVDQPYQDPNQELTTGVWRGFGGCFYINQEGTHIVENELCDQGKALSVENPGFEVNINGFLNTQTCHANTECEGAWEICLTCSPVSVNCTDGLNGASNIFFDSATEARVESFQGGLGAGAMCLTTFHANP